MKTVCFLALALPLLGCGSAGSGTYCQSGAKYGTQCYSQADVGSPPGQRPPAPADSSGERR